MTPMYTSVTDGSRSGMGFSFMEAFMDELEVTSTVGEGTVVKAEYKLVGKSGTVYDKGSYENTSSFTVSGTMKEATGSIVVTWTVQTGETDEAGNPATVTLDPVTYSVP